MKFLNMFLVGVAVLSMTSCSTYTPPPEPTGEKVPINGPVGSAIQPLDDEHFKPQEQVETVLVRSDFDFLTDEQKDTVIEDRVKKTRK